MIDGAALLKARLLKDFLVNGICSSAMDEECTGCGKKK